MVFEITRRDAKNKWSGNLARRKYQASDRREDQCDYYARCNFN